MESEFFAWNESDLQKQFTQSSTRRWSWWFQKAQHLQKNTLFQHSTFCNHTYICAWWKSTPQDFCQQNLMKPQIVPSNKNSTILGLGCSSTFTTTPPLVRLHYKFRVLLNHRHRKRTRHEYWEKNIISQASTCAGRFIKSLLQLHTLCLPNSSKTSWTRAFVRSLTYFCQTILVKFGSSDLKKGNFYSLLRNCKIDTRRATSHTLERIITRFTTPQLNISF